MIFKNTKKEFNKKGTNKKNRKKTKKDYNKKGKRKA